MDDPKELDYTTGNFIIQYKYKENTLWCAIYDYRL